MGHRPESGPRPAKPGTRRFAEQQIARQDQVTCVCGQLFFNVEPYFEHYRACPIVERGTGQPADFDADEARPKGEHDA